MTIIDNEIIDAELLAEFVDESVDSLTETDQLFVQLELNPTDLDVVQAIFRPVHSVKGNSVFFGLLQVKTLAHELETLLDRIRKRELVADAGIISVLLAGIDELKAMLFRARDQEPEVTRHQAFDGLVERIKVAASGETRVVKQDRIWWSVFETLTGLQDEFGAESPKLWEEIEAILSTMAQAMPVSSAPPAATHPEPFAAKGEEPEPRQAPPASATNAAKDSAKTMRIAESHVDTFLSFVGELIVVGDLFKHLEGRVGELEDCGSLLAEFRRANETFSSLSDNLRDSIMQIRKVPVNKLLGRVPRIVRDISTSSSKKMTVETVGEDIRIDKSHVDLLEAPLMHMVRNAADHGIESPEERAASGKIEAGLVRVGIEEGDRHIVLTVSDDGRGLDLEAIREKGVGLGLIRKDAPLAQQDIINLIFSSGISTARSVTDVSGRGVGMDVVKRGIDSAGGWIRVDTEAGSGTTMQVFLPKSVTTQIMTGFLVEIAGQRFFFPMDKVLETFQMRPSETKSLKNQGRCVVRHGQTQPVLEIRKVLDLPGYNLGSEPEIAVTVATGASRVVVFVDAVLGVQQMVVREISGLSKSSEIVVGAALMGDNSVVLILDLDKITP